MAVRVLDRREVRRTRRPTPRAPITEISRSRSTNASSTASLPPERRPRRGSASPRRLEPRPAPCRRSRSRRLQHRRPADARDRRAQIRRRSRPARTASTGRPRSARNVFSRMRCCAMCERAAARAARSRALRPRPRPPPARSRTRTSRRRRRGRTSRIAIEVVVRRVDLDVGDLAGRRVVLGRERVDAVAEAAGGHGEHAAELAAAEHADGRRREESARSRERIAAHRTSAAISSRYACSFARSSGRDVARMATASSPALAAPDAPIATVATGTPFGICTIDSSESRPFSAALCTGTPITGSTVCAATMPGRCAAPPAPAMITSRPRLRRRRRVLGHPAPACGAPTRRGTRAARRTASGSRRPAASCPSPTCCP